MAFKTRCYLVYGIAPSELKAVQVNQALNNWIKNEKLGRIIYHEHFAHKPLGGIAVFEVRSPEELKYLKEEPTNDDSCLHGWNLSFHPMVHSTTAQRFVYQTQYTLAAYRGVEMTYHFSNNEGEKGH
jgi:hypothetical protein